MASFKSLLPVGVAAVAGAAIASGLYYSATLGPSKKGVVLTPYWAHCLNERWVSPSSTTGSKVGTFDNHTYHSSQNVIVQENLACIATPEILQHADYDWSNVESKKGGLNSPNIVADDDLFISFKLTEVGLIAGSDVHYAALRVWAYPSDNGPREIQIGRWQDHKDHRPTSLSSAEQKLGNLNEYGSAAPGLPAVYTNEQLLSDVKQAAGGDFVAWLQTTCTAGDDDVFAWSDCGALVDKIDLVIDFTPPVEADSQ